MIQHVEVRDVFSENTYFFIDPSTRQAFLIDPGAEPERLFQIIEGNGLDIRAILLTHGHFDHTGAIAFLHERLGIPYYISPPGEAYLTDPALNLSQECGRYSVLPDAQFFKPGDFLPLSGDSRFGLEVIATPGHTPDSVTFYSAAEKAAFVGDTIFKGSPGLTNFPGGNRRDLFASILERILVLPDETALYSGHTPPTSVGEEKPAYEPYMQG
ncbi:MAG: MBL fold metallo-hydrolase [Desulfovibrio sp.]|nr:MBL fold metallo-hydrolase [Desulfovibrio sp.]